MKQYCTVPRKTPAALHTACRETQIQRDRIVLELDQFIADCRAAITADKSQKFVREVVTRALSDPPAVLKALGELRE